MSPPACFHVPALPSDYTRCLSSHLFLLASHPIQAPARPTTHRCGSLSRAGASPWHCPERPAQWPGPGRHSARLPTLPLFRDTRQRAQYSDYPPPSLGNRLPAETLPSSVEVPSGLTSRTLAGVKSSTRHNHLLMLRSLSWGRFEHEQLTRARGSTTAARGTPATNADTCQMRVLDAKPGRSCPPSLPPSLPYRPH